MISVDVEGRGVYGTLARIFVAVVVDVVTQFVCVWINRVVGIVAIVIIVDKAFWGFTSLGDRGGISKSISVFVRMVGSRIFCGVLVDGSIAVVVNTVAKLRCTWRD